MFFYAGKGSRSQSGFGFSAGTVRLHFTQLIQFQGKTLYYQAGLAVEFLYFGGTCRPPFRVGQDFREQLAKAVLEMEKGVMEAQPAEGEWGR